MTSVKLVARLRVPLGFAGAIVVYWIAHPTPRSLLAGGVVAIIGELVRWWAAGHLDKEKEVTRSGPYRYVRHPLYLGSAIMGAGLAVASHSIVAAVLLAVYLFVTYRAAMRVEEASLERLFKGEYAAYREGRASPITRRFSMERVRANREGRSIAGLVAGLGLLFVRMKL